MDEQKKKPKENTLYVKGMHCAACEILIEKKLLKLPQITAVDVSRGNQTAKIYVERGSFVDIDELNKNFAEDNYSFSKKPFEQEKKSWKMPILVALSFLLAFYILEKFQLGRFVSVDATSSYFAFLLLGLVAGISSCAALIGGILLSLIKHWNEKIMETPGASRSKPHVLFHAGRLIAFFTLGGILGLMGDVVSLNNTTVYALLVMIISLAMFILALQMLEVSWAQKIQIRLPKFLTRLAAKPDSGVNTSSPVIIGATTFFLPCGFTLIAQGVALTTGSFFQGALIMLFFAIGTLPMLLGISMTGLTFTKRPHKAARFAQISGIIILFFALYNINGQLNVLGLPSLSDLSFGSNKPAVVECDPSITSCLDENNEQTISIVAEGFDYIATGPTVFQAGVPTKLVVDDQGILGCGRYIAARGLFPRFVSLNPGLNTIDIPNPKKGSYKLTCSMGMVAPVTLTFK